MYWLSSNWETIMTLMNAFGLIVVAKGKKPRAKL